MVAGVILHARTETTNPAHPLTAMSGHELDQIAQLGYEWLALRQVR